MLFVILTVNAYALPHVAFFGDSITARRLSYFVGAAGSTSAVIDMWPGTDINMSGASLENYYPVHFGTGCAASATCASSCFIQCAKEVHAIDPFDYIVIGIGETDMAALHRNYSDTTDTWEGNADLWITEFKEAFIPQVQADFVGVPIIMLWSYPWNDDADKYGPVGTGTTKVICTDWADCTRHSNQNRHYVIHQLESFFRDEGITVIDLFHKELQVYVSPNPFLTAYGLGGTDYLHLKDYSVWWGVWLKPELIRIIGCQ